MKYLNLAPDGAKTLNSDNPGFVGKNKKEKITKTINKYR